MMRVLEFLAALVIVVVIGVVAAVVMPSSGHVERSLVIGKDMRQVYDLLDNFRRLPDYSVLRCWIPRRSSPFPASPTARVPRSAGPAPTSKVGKGGLTIASATPDFDKIDSNTKQATIIWNLDNDWRGLDKHFTLDLERKGSRGQLTQVTWAYDVAYGWNLVNRFANLYIHGDPDAFIQFGLNNLQNVLAGVPNIDYSPLVPYIEQTQPTPVLLVSTSIERKDGLDALDDAVNTATTEIEAAAKKLGVNVTGPRILFTTNYGDQTYTFDVALPIDSSTLTVNGQSEQLTARDAAVAGYAPRLPAPPPAALPAAADADLLSPGSRDRFGRLVVDNNVRATLAFGGAALKGVWNGTFAGVPQTRDMLKAYAQTHGYTFDEVVNRPYDVVDEAGSEGRGGQYHRLCQLRRVPADHQCAGTDPGAGSRYPAAVDGRGRRRRPASGSAPAPASSAAPAEAASAGE